jgi:hypothetical protein
MLRASPHRRWIALELTAGLGAEDGGAERRASVV